MSYLAAFKRLLIGRPIATKHAHHQRLPKVFALPVFASDALSSVAYATEETMRVLAVAGFSGLALTFDISIAIVVLIIMVATSYYQTIQAYPQGGGSYIVASENLGSLMGRIAGASLMIDYILTVSVSVSAGILALESLWPALHPFIIEVDVAAILAIAIVNLRGTKESGMLFAVFTYSFIFLTLTMVGVGLFQLMLGTAHPAPMHQIPLEHKGTSVAMTVAGVFLVLRAFSSGCSAMTGIEAISDGVQAFQKPEARNASITLAVMAVILSTMFLGSSWLAHQLNIVPMQQDAHGYKTVLAMICLQVFGNGWYFSALQIFTAFILVLAANTAFADFPRLCSFIARDGFLPRQLASIGDRLVFQNGIVVLTVFACTLIVGFKGKTEALIPLYAIGVFTAFTLSQIGMFVHIRHTTRTWTQYISLMGGIVTGIVTIIIIITKVGEGGWIVLVAVTLLNFLFAQIRKHYDYLAGELSVTPDDELHEVPTTVLLLVPRLHKGILQAVGYAQSMTRDVRALHVTLDIKGDTIKEDWNRFGIDIPLVILESPYRSLLEPITDYIDETISEDPSCMITVIVPQAVPKHWYQGLLHNNAAVPLKWALRSRKNVVITNVRYFLK